MDGRSSWSTILIRWVASGQIVMMRAMLMRSDLTCYDTEKLCRYRGSSSILRLGRAGSPWELRSDYSERLDWIWAFSNGRSRFAFSCQKGWAPGLRFCTLSIHRAFRFFKPPQNEP